MKTIKSDGATSFQSKDERNCTHSNCCLGSSLGALRGPMVKRLNLVLIQTIKPFIFLHMPSGNYSSHLIVPQIERSLRNKTF